jgi:protocatechuate 3,4-dioxygenase beta subunit
VTRPPDTPPERGALDASARKASDRSGPKSVVSGTVIASDPIPGAQISIVDGEEVLAETESDRGGAFRLEFSAGAETRLRVRARGWAPLEVSLRSVQPGQTRMLGNLRLEAGKLLQGVVYGAEGRPLPDAQILVSSIGTRPTANAFQHRTKTDALGHFQVTDVPLGRTHVQASAAGHERRIAVVQHGDRKSVEIRLGKETTLRVRVRGPGGEPVPEAHVSVHSRQERQSFDARADEDGICMFHGLAPGRWTLRCTEAGFRPVNRVEEVGDATEIELQLAAWPCVTGKVASTDGSALGSGVRVDVLAAGDRVPENAALVVATDATDENGAFRVCGLRPGDYRVRVQAERFAPSLSSVFRVQVEGDVGIGTLKVDAGSTLQLSLSVEGQPLGGAT